MNYQIFKIENGREEPVGRVYTDEDVYIAEAIVKDWNNNRKNKKDPFYFVGKLFEIIRGE